jgi:hypothetical protein
MCISKRKSLQVICEFYFKVKKISKALSPKVASSTSMLPSFSCFLIHFPKCLGLTTKYVWLY